MHTKKILAGAAITAATAAMSAGPALAGTLPKVHVRIEGRSKTLLLNKAVRPNGKRVRRDGHTCRGNTLLDPFNVATKGRWSGTWYSGLGWDINRALGETESYTKTGHYYDLFVNNVSASEGLCSLTIHRGEHILLAAVPDTGTEFPTGITAPATATKGKALTMHVVLYNAKGRPHSLKGATVTGGGVKATTNNKGSATIVPAHTGRLVLTASAKGEIRSESVVQVAS